MNIVRGTMTLSLTMAERKKIEQLMERWKLTQHAVVKVALRYFLFPEERSKIPVDGYVAVKESDGEMLIEDRIKVT